MGFFRQVGNALVRFMYGRNGVDQLNVALLWGYLLAAVLRIIQAMTLQLAILDVLLDVVQLVMLAVMVFRMFSKNLPKRRAENQKWVNWWWRVKNAGSASLARRADKDHKYFVCKNCKTVCRVPVGKGKIIITCPKCGAQIHAKS